MHAKVTGKNGEWKWANWHLIRTLDGKKKKYHRNNKWKKWMKSAFSVCNDNNGKLIRCTIKCTTDVN